MNHYFLATLILGLSLKETSILQVFLHQFSNRYFGEIPGSNLRNLLGLTKDQLFLELEKLVQRNIFKFSTYSMDESVFVAAGKGYYIFNSTVTEWIPSAESTFYKICKIKGYHFNRTSYLQLLRELNFTNELVIAKKEAEEKVTPYEAFDWFCGLHKKTFGREYSPINQVRDFATLKKILCDMTFRGFSKGDIREFFQWCFLSKVKDFKSAFIVGFLPMCLEDYRTLVNVPIISEKFRVDEDGRMRVKNNENKQP